MANIITKVFRSSHDREVKRLRPVVNEINEIYEKLADLSDEELKNKTVEFRNKIDHAVKDIRGQVEQIRSELHSNAVGVDENHDAPDIETLRTDLEKLEKEEDEIVKDVLNEIMPEAFAVVKETCRRLVGKRWKVCDQDIEWDMIPFDVQLIGAMVLHEGKIVEMATGEGKTLVASLPIYLNALPGKGVHLITVNDYLARRDCEWMGEIYEFLGLTVDYITNDMNPEQRRKAYNADITYGTNNEFGFDYLRDNMAARLDDCVQRLHNYAIIDEVDSVLIDEARTPLIISGPVEHSTHKFHEVKPSVEQLVRSQTSLGNQIVAEAEDLLKQDNEYEAGIKLLQAERGTPKNKRFAKLLQEVGIKKLIRRVENDYLRDKKLHEIDEALYFAIDEKGHTIDLTEKGRQAISPNDPETFILPDLSTGLSEIDQDEAKTDEEKAKDREALNALYAERSERIHNISQLLRAYSLFEKDVEYVVSEDRKVMIVDEFTGRLMPGRRYSDGLHQALEAKEGVEIERETQTLATITLQNFFRLYKKLAGMTGTAETEASEFWEIYKLDVVVIPTNEPVRRIDHDDEIYRTKREKYNAVIDEIVNCYEAKRPVLVGTITVDVSETLSRMLKRRKISHSVLNAKYHQQEAEIVTRAGQPGSVTIATNMAGRGTDIKLGAGVVRHTNCAVIDPDKSLEICPHLDEYKCRENVPCGLHIIGTERHESRRIDRQLRGRSGRQGDPGSSRFYLCLEDDLMRLFGSERIAGVMDRLGAQDGEVIKHPMVSKSIERAQKRVEGHNFDIRKHLLEYDDVMNQQREVVYSRRRHALEGENLKDDVFEMINDFIEGRVERYADESLPSEEWDWDGIRADFQRVFLRPPLFADDETIGLRPQDLYELLGDKAQALYAAKEADVSEELMRELERLATLRVIDDRWRDHLYAMDQMKEGIGLRAYGQKDPLLEYKSEAFSMFTDMLSQISEEVVALIFKARIREEPSTIRGRTPAQIRASHASAAGMGFAGQRGAPPQQEQTAGKRQPVRVTQKVGRNDPCPCGSGKKYKKCCGLAA